MRRWLIIALGVLAGCSPVLDKRFLEEGARDFQLNHLVETPEVFKDRLFVLGGVIVETKLVEAGSQVEAVFVPVNAYGDLRDLERYQGRFLALYPRSLGILDPVIYRKGRAISLAGTFGGVKKGKIDELEYSYPVFEVRQVHLWEEYGPAPYGWQYPYYAPYYYPAYYRGYYPYDPWFRPYPYGPPFGW